MYMSQIYISSISISFRAFQFIFIKTYLEVFQWIFQSYVEKIQGK